MRIIYYYIKYPPPPQHHQWHQPGAPSPPCLTSILLIKSIEEQHVWGETENFQTPAGHSVGILNLKPLFLTIRKSLTTHPVHDKYYRSGIWWFPFSLLQETISRVWDCWARTSYFFLNQKKCKKCKSSIITSNHSSEQQSFYLRA